MFGMKICLKTKYNIHNRNMFMFLNKDENNTFTFDFNI